MHRQLIARVNGILAEVGDPSYPQVEGWVQLPGPDDIDYPVPPPWFDSGALPIRNRYVVRMKTDVVLEKNFRHWAKTVSDPVFLRSVSLGTLGALIDYFLVDPVRRRWSAAPGATRAGSRPQRRGDHPARMGRFQIRLPWRLLLDACQSHPLAVRGLDR